MKNLRTKKTNIFLSLILLSAFSCSTGKTLFEVSGVERMVIDQDDYKKPQFLIGEHNLKKSRNLGRSIASVMPISSSDGQSDKKLSNRQVYFLTFYSQYQTMLKLVGERDTLRSCPSFHDVILDQKEKMNFSYSDYSLNLNYKVVQQESKNSPYFPILALPVNNEKDLHSELASADWKNSKAATKDALKEYLGHKKKELGELCDTGVSAGYYIFENLVTYFKKDTSFHGTKDGLRAMLKVPVMANMIILDNLKKHSIGEGKNPYHSLVINRTDAHWFQNFRDDLKEKRREYLSHNKY